MAYTSPRTWTPGTIVTDVMLNTDIRDNFLALFGTTGIMVSGTHMVGPIIDSGGLTITAGTPALTLPAQSGGVAKTISWTDAGAGLTSILGNTTGGVPTSNVLRFDIASGTGGGSTTALTLDGSGKASVGVGGVAVAGGGVTVTSGGLTVTAGNIGIGAAAGTPHLTLVGQSGGVAKSISWTDIGAGFTSILGNTVGGSAAGCVLRFDIANGVASGSVTALTLDGNGKATTGGALVIGTRPAFATGDKYLIVDASGNVHVSGLGPAS